MQLRMGAMSPPLHEQYGMDAEDWEWEQKFADAITLLHVHSLLTDAETHRARKRLVKRLNEKMDKFNEEDES